MSEIESRTATRTPRMLPLLSLTVAVLAAGCAQVGIGGNKSESTAAAPAPAPAPAAAPAAPKSKAGMNDRGEVVDSSKVEAGSGVTV